jgi:hypothetical protein
MQTDLKELLADAYRAPAPGAETIERIRRRAVQARRPENARSVWSRIVLMAALGLVSALGYPVFRANLFCLSLASKLHSPLPYSVTITSPAYAASGRSASMLPMRVVFSQGNYVAEDGLGNAWMPLGRERCRMIYPREHVSVIEPTSARSPFFTLPYEAVEKLSGWDSRRRLQSGVPAFENGESVDRYRVNVDDEPPVEVSVNRRTGLPVVVRVASADEESYPGWALEYRFNFDVQRALQLSNRIVTSFDHEVDKTRPARMRKPLQAHPLLRASLGRDMLTVFDFERLPSGAQFVLYTMSGYHDGRQGSFMRLRDGAGHSWLPEYVDMTGSFKLDGHTPIGQVFFPPSRASNAAGELYVRHLQWEIQPQIVQDPLSDPGYRFRNLGHLTPAAASRPPDWFYFNFANCSWSDYEAAGAFLQAHDAVDRGDASVGVAKGRQALARMDEGGGFLFIPRTQLLCDLGRAYFGLGDLVRARKYLRGAVAEAKASPGQSPRLLRVLANACRRAGVRDAEL